MQRCWHHHWFEFLSGMTISIVLVIIRDKTMIEVFSMTPPPHTHTRSVGPGALFLQCLFILLSVFTAIQSLTTMIDL